jgi:hypothetical protein
MELEQMAPLGTARAPAPCLLSEAGSACAAAAPTTSAVAGSPPSAVVPDVFDDPVADQALYLDVGDVPDFDIDDETQRDLMIQQTQAEIDGFREMLAEARSAGDLASAAEYKKQLAKQLSDLKTLKEHASAKR